MHRSVAATVVVAACTLAPLAIGLPSSHAQSLGAAGPQIGLKNLKFDPKKVTAKVKQKITFVWKEKVAHNVVFDNKGPKSKLLSKGTFIVSFDKPGHYTYQCSIHPGMKGEVDVKK